MKFQTQRNLIRSSDGVFLFRVLSCSQLPDDCSLCSQIGSCYIALRFLRRLLLVVHLAWEEMLIEDLALVKF